MQSTAVANPSEGVESDWRCNYEGYVTINDFNIIANEQNSLTTETLVSLIVARVSQLSYKKHFNQIENCLALLASTNVYQLSRE